MSNLPEVEESLKESLGESPQKVNSLLEKHKLVESLVNK